MNKKNPFNNLPTVASLRTETGIEQFRKNIKEEELTEKDSYMLQIKFLIYIKLIFHLWNLNDYKNFKTIFDEVLDWSIRNKKTVPFCVFSKINYCKSKILSKFAR